MTPYQDARADQDASSRPLSGKSVLVTRPRQQSDSMTRRLLELGADVLTQPAIRIVDPPDWGPVDEALARLGQYDWLVFSSANGVRYLLDRLRHRGGLRQLAPVRLAAIGPGTAEELARHDLRADLVPTEYRAEALADQLLAACSLPRPTAATDTSGPNPTPEAPVRKAPCFLLARASRGREVLAERLRDAGAGVDQIVVYSSLDVEEPEPAVAAALSAGQIDYATVTSSAIARSLAVLFGEDLRKARLISISPITSATLRHLGYETAAEAVEYTIDGVIEAILSQL